MSLKQSRIIDMCMDMHYIHAIDMRIRKNDRANQFIS